MRRIRQILLPIIYFVIIPLVIACGMIFFGTRSYHLISATIALLVCISFFIRFESGKTTFRELVAIAIMTAIAVLGRLIFAPIQGCKPITAIIIITAISFGCEAGFLVGSLSVFISNIYFMHGPWSPFQMLAFGTLGFLAALVGKTGIMQRWWGLVLAGIVGGFLYSLMVDVWTVLAISDSFSVRGYFAVVATSLPWSILYAVSNVVFLLLLSKTITNKLMRLKLKYNLFL